MIARRQARSWPIAERADDMARSELVRFDRLVRDLPDPGGPFLIPSRKNPGELIYASFDPWARKRRRWFRWSR